VEATQSVPAEAQPLPVAVAVISFNTREVLQACLDSVMAAGAVETVVVDNASTDASAKMVRQRFPTVRLVANDANRGYGAAANQAIDACSSAVVLLLNSDTVLRPDALRALGAYLRAHPRAGVAGPGLVHPDGSLQRSTYPFPSAADTFLGESGLHVALRAVPVLRERFLRTWSHDRARPVSWVLGAALAIRRTAWADVAGFDEGYFMYGEEVDLCRRLAAAGFETHYAPVTTVVHLGAASTARAPVAMLREFIVSKRRYLRRHVSRCAGIRLLMMLQTIYVARLARDAVRLRLARDDDERRQLHRSVTGWRAILAERALWRL
jgi:GT2 family glycosyltransferase